MINKAVLEKLGEATSDTQKTLNAQRRLHALANRVLHLPKAPMQIIVAHDHRPASARSLSALERLQRQVAEETSTSTAREALFKSLLPARDEGDDDDDDDDGSTAAGDNETQRQMRQHTMMMMSQRFSADGLIHDPERPWRVLRPWSQRATDAERERRLLRHPVTAAMLPSAAVRTTSPTPAVALAPCAAIISTAASVAGASPVVAASSAAGTTAGAAAAQPFSYLQPVGFAALRQQQAAERRRRKEVEQERIKREQAALDAVIAAAEAEQRHEREFGCSPSPRRRAPTQPAAPPRIGLAPRLVVVPDDGTKPNAERVLAPFFRRTHAPAAAAASALDCGDSRASPPRRDSEASSASPPPASYRRQRMYSAIAIVEADESNVSDSRGSLPAAYSMTRVRRRSSGGASGGPARRPSTALARSVAEFFESDDERGCVEDEAAASNNTAAPRRRDSGVSTASSGNSAAGSPRRVQIKSPLETMRGDLLASAARKAFSGDAGSDGDDADGATYSFSGDEGGSGGGLPLDHCDSVADLARSTSVVSGIFTHHSDHLQAKKRVVCASDQRLKYIERYWPIYEHGMDAQLAALRAPASSSPYRGGVIRAGGRGRGDFVAGVSFVSGRSMRQLTGGMSFRAGRPLPEDEAELKQQHRLYQRMTKPLKAVVAHEKQMALDEKEMRVTQTDRFLRLRDGTGRPLRSAFLAAVRSAGSSSAAKMGLPSTSWHVDFAVRDRESDVWNAWTCALSRVLDDGSRQCLLREVTFSGVARGFDSKELILSEPAAVSEISSESHAHEVASAFLPGEESAATNRLLDSSWTAAGILHHHHHDDHHRQSPGRSMRPANNSELGAPAASASDASSRLLRSVERFRQKRRDASEPAAAAHDVRTLAAAAATAAAVTEASSAHSSTRVPISNIAFISCDLNKSARFFRRLAAGTPRLELRSVHIEHCTWPHKRFAEANEQDERGGGGGLNTSTDSLSTTTTGATATPGNLSARTGSLVLNTPLAVRLGVTTPRAKALAARAASATPPLSAGTASNSFRVIPPTPPSAPSAAVADGSVQQQQQQDQQPLRVAWVGGLDADEMTNQQQQQQQAGEKKRSVSILDPQEEEEEVVENKSDSSSEEDDEDDEGFSGLRDPDEEFGNALIAFLESQADTLESLSLHGTRFSVGFAQKLATLLRSKRLVRLTHVDLGLTGIEALDNSSPLLIRTVASAIAHCPTLRVLDLQGTPFAPAHVGIALIAAVRANTSIDQLLCSGCDGANGTKFEKIASDLLEERRRAKEHRARERERRRRKREATRAALEARSPSASSSASDGELLPTKSVALIDAFQLDF